MIALEKISLNQDVFFLFLLSAFLLISILKAFYWKYTKLLIMGVFSERYTNQYLREENVFTERVGVITFLLLLLNLSLFVTRLNGKIKLDFFLWTILFIAAYYLIKYMLIRLLGIVFLLKNIAQLGVFFSFLFDKVLAIFIFPLIVVLHYSKMQITTELLVVCNVLILIFLALKIFWMWRIATNTFGLTPLYIFLYLCILEIFPLLVLGRGVVY